MILLDTNVVSELRKVEVRRADPAVAAWIGRHVLADLYLSAITVIELEVGVLRITDRDPVQADHLRRWLEISVLPSFEARILPIDVAIARRCATLQVAPTKSYADSLIAATALVHDLTLATRNTRDFAGTGVRLVDPWSYRVGTGSSPDQS